MGVLKNANSLRDIHSIRRILPHRSESIFLVVLYGTTAHIIPRERQRPPLRRTILRNDPNTFISGSSEPGAFALAGLRPLTLTFWAARRACARGWAQTPVELWTSPVLGPLLARAGLEEASLLATDDGAELA